jgi:tetratricopeptide (TPR) repeat protein
MHPLRFKLLPLVVLALLPSVTQAQHAMAAPPSRGAKLISGLGSLHHPVSTRNEEAQQYFDQGLKLVYGFNRWEARKSFRRAAELDPQLAMAHWGIALSLGPYINSGGRDSASEREAYAEVQKALALMQHASAHDQAYIRAIAVRHSEDPKASAHTLDVAYKDAMAALAKEYPEDMDAQTLYAEALMDLHPWNLWRNDGSPNEGTEEIVSVLERALAKDSTHTGANHYYIHAVEASPRPERALPSANRIGRLAPGAGHLVHMAGHIFLPMGMLDSALDSNERASQTDRDYFEDGGEVGYMNHYYVHNLNFLSIAHAIAGNYEGAIRTVTHLEGRGPHGMMSEPRMRSAYERIRPMLLVRLQKWDEILKLTAPDSGQTYGRLAFHFARGMALAKSNVDSAAKELEIYRAIMRKQGISSASAMTVGEHLLSATVDQHRGDRAAAIATLRRGIGIEDSLAYSEPPGWYIPLREKLGALLLASGDLKGAEAVFREDLKFHRRSPRSLFGIAEVLRRAGDPGAEKAKAEFEAAWARADTKLRIEEF